VGESSKMYYPEMELTRNARHIINSEFGYFIIFDDLRSKMEHIYTWNIHSEKFAKKLENNKYGIINGNASLIIHTPFPDNSNKNIDETIIEEIMTPQRPNDKRIISLKTLKIENSKKEKNTSFVNVLVPNDLFEKDEVYINKIESHKQTGVEIQGKNHVEIFLFSCDGTINHKGEEIEGTWMSIVEDLNGKTIKKKIY